MAQDMCRVCMKTEESSMYSVYKPYPGGEICVVDLIVSLAQVEIRINDNLPQLICRICLNNLEVANNLIQTCKDSDRQLRQMLLSEKQSISRDEYHVIEAINEVEVVNQSDEEDDPEECSEQEAPIELLDIEDIIEEETFDSDDETVSKQDDISASLKLDELISTDPAIQNANDRTQCCGCSERFDSFEQLQQHSREHHFPERAISGPVPTFLLECTICYKLFAGLPYLDSTHQLPALKDRLVSAEFPEVVQCCSCETLCSGREELLQHSSEHLGARKEDDPERPFECEFCFRRFTQNPDLSYHQRFSFSYKKVLRMKRRICMATRRRNEMEQSTASRKCCGCSAKFPSEDSLKQHSQMHHELYRRQPDRKNPFECDICFRQFPSAARLKQHKLVPYSRVHQCSQCDKSFISAPLLAKHAESHSPNAILPKPPKKQDGPDFQCDECGKIFKNKCYLQQHWKCQHSQEKVFSCSICQRMFKWKHTLQGHLRSHTNERPYGCSYCERKFAHLTDKNRHELSHSKQFPLRCSVCDKGYPAGRKKQLAKHMQLHEAGEEYPLRCKFCDRTFTRIDLRNRHQATHVQMDETD